MGAQGWNVGGIRLKDFRSLLKEPSSDPKILH